jgi:spoIIIJ-associated protein
MAQVDDDDDDDFVADVGELYDGPLDEDAEVGRVVLAELLEKMSVRAQIEIRRAESGDGESPPWLLDIAGSGDMSGLIGRRGETLASLQYITRLITSRELQRRANIVVDVGGYKRRRTMKLNELARRMADQAIDQQKTITLEPMPPYERRIVHLALRDREDVLTKSVGEGQSRKVTIVPR